MLSGAVMSLQNSGPVPLAKRREDDVSVGSTPRVKQPSNQASDYASSPLKTKTVTGELHVTNKAVMKRSNFTFFITSGRYLKIKLEPNKTKQ